MATATQKDRALKLAIVIIRGYAESAGGGTPKRTDFGKMLENLYRKTVTLVEDADKDD